MSALHGFTHQQAHLLGYPAHSMGVILKDKLVEAPKILEDHKVETGIAIGTLTDKSVLPEDLTKREVPSKHLPLSDVVSKGGSSAKLIDTRPSG